MLDIYETANPLTAYTVSGEFTNPFSCAFDGVAGEVVERRVYLRNDDPLYFYENITVQPVDGGDSIVDGSGVTEGYSWKLSEGDQQPGEEEWSYIDTGNEINFDDLGSLALPDISTYLPFWVRVEVPKGAPVESFKNVYLRITFDETEA
jgi:hypothetical protein